MKTATKTKEKPKTDRPYEIPMASGDSKSTTLAAIAKLKENPDGIFVQDVPLHWIEPSKTNPRKYFDPEQLAELSQSIKAHGVVQPIVVRFVKWRADNGNPILEIVAGERRFRGSMMASRPTMPAIIRQLDDRPAMEIQQIENLHRADIHPMDEAHGFSRLIKEFGYTVDSIAAKLPKPAPYVLRRMKLVDLIKPLQDLFWKKEMQIGHAELLCKFAAADQVAILKDGLINYNKEVVPLNHLKNAIERTLVMDLSRAPWKLDDKTLPPLACAVCPKRTGANPTLFGTDFSGKDICTDRSCYTTKRDAFVAQLREKNPDMVAVGTSYNGKAAAGLLPYGKYATSYGEKCPHLEDAIAGDGDSAGKILKICKEKKCPRHGNQLGVSRSNAGGPSNFEENEQEHRYRTENLARFAAFTPLATTLTSPDKALPKVGLDELRLVAAFTYREIPSPCDRRLIQAAFGMDAIKATDSGKRFKKLDDMIKTASYERLLVLIVLFSLAKEMQTSGYEKTPKKSEEIPVVAKAWKLTKTCDMLESAVRTAAEERRKKRLAMRNKPKGKKAAK